MDDHISQEAFLIAYDTYADVIFRHCYYRLGDRERAKELMQEAFMRVWDYQRNGGTVENIRAFLYRIANNLMIDEVRKKHPVSLDAMMEEDTFEPTAEDERIMEKIDAKSAMDLLQKLDEVDRNILVMRYIDGLSPLEISGILEESTNVVSVRLYRALAKLRSLYNKPLGNISTINYSQKKKPACVNHGWLIGKKILFW
ncbi:RNA polymerase sigma factor [Candidatus Gracilibacteria bacterium]|nr:RNA polymerase sigma factor [Candidatus Gracilibacteria bacterium]